MFASIARPVRPAEPLLSLNIDRLLAAVHDPDGAARAGRAGARLLHRDGRPGPGLRPGRRGAVAGRRRRLLPRDAGRSATRRSARPGPAGRVTLIEGDTQRLPVPSDTFGVVTVAFGLRNVGRHRPRDRRDDPRRPAGREGGDPRVLAAPRAGPRPALSRASSARSCPGSARRSPRTSTTPTTTCPRACCSSPTARRCSTCSPRGA